MTIFAMVLSLGMLTPTTVEARDNHRHRHSSHSHRHHTSRHHHHHHYSSSRYRHYHYNPYYYGYRSPVVYRERVLIGYDRYGYPIYSWRTPYRSSGFSLSFGF